ncbi:hypothetical protein FRC05_009373 [Tulasnella sp. 425]|nr:hypothetical protein FRC05_009373 [Tulasnella sp. 425]
MSRRSPRNHSASPASTTFVNLRVKPAAIPWSDPTFSLEYHLVAALETNHRWRHGLFSNVTPRDKTQYCDEIARALFARHPYFAKPYKAKPSAYANAVKEKVEGFPTFFKAMALNKARTRRTIAEAERNISSALRSTSLWKRHRLERESSGNIISATWRPALPLELQLQVLRHFINVDPVAHSKYRNGDPLTPPAKEVDRTCAAVACLVNRSWYSEAVHWLYTAVTISRPGHYAGVFCPSSFLNARYRSETTKTLKLLTPVPRGLFYFDLATVPYIQFDFGSSCTFFDIIEPQSGKRIEDLDRSEARIGALALNSVPLYQLTMGLATRKLRLFISKDHAVDPQNDIWQDLVGGHIAALRMMVHLEHLVIDADVYLLLLPGYFKEWCRSPHWRQALASVRAEAETMATFFDETPLRTMTLISDHVPTLAFLAAISRAPQISRINLVGWNKPALDPSWAAFLEEEKNCAGVVRWSDEDPDEL